MILTHSLKKLIPGVRKPECGIIGQQRSASSRLPGNIHVGIDKRIFFLKAKPRRFSFYNFLESSLLHVDPDIRKYLFRVVKLEKPLTNLSI